MTNLEKLEKIFKEYKDDLEPGTLREDTTFEELNFDSLDVVDLIMACEDEFGVTIGEDQELKTVGDLLKIVDEAEEN